MFISPKLIKSGIVILFGQIVIAISGLIMVRVLTEKLSPSEYGLLTLGISFSLFANQILFGPLGAGLVRFYTSAKENKEENELISSIINLVKYFLIVFFVLSVIPEVILLYLNSLRWSVLIFLGIIFSFVVGINSLLNGIFLAENSQKTLTLFQVVEPISRLLISLFLIYQYKPTAEYVLIGFLVGTLLISFFQIKKIRECYSENNANKKYKIKKWEEKIFKYGLPYAIWGLFTAAQLASDRWVLNFTQGQNEVGLYTTLYQIGYVPVTMLIGIIGQIMTPYLFEKAGDGTEVEKNKEVNKVTIEVVKVCIFITFALVFFGFLLSDVVYKIFVSEQYFSVSGYLPIIIFAAGVFASAQVASLALQSGPNSNPLILIKITCALLGILLNYVFGKYFSILGILISLSIISVFYLVWILIKVRFRNDLHINL